MADEKQEITLNLQTEDEDLSGQQENLKVGDECPKCHQATLDYDGLLNIVCPVCGYTLAGCFT